MTLEEAIERQRERYDAIIGAATMVYCDVAGGLAEVGEKPVEVRCVPSRLFNAVMGQRTNSCTMMYEGWYAIFISDQPLCLRLEKLQGHWLRRFLVLHEYGHILHGDVFEGNPQASYDRQMRASQGDPQAQKELDEQEEWADGYAAHKLKEEATQAVKPELVLGLLSFIKEKGLPKP